MVYLDNAATTFPKPECVYKAMDKMNREGAVNAGRGSYRLAQNASRLIFETKELLRNLIHVNISAAVILSPSITINLLFLLFLCCSRFVTHLQFLGS